MSAAVITKNLGEGYYKVNFVYNLNGIDDLDKSLFKLPQNPIEYFAWCTDYSTDIDVGTIVGIIDLAGWLERGQVDPLIIQAGWNDEQEEPDIDCEHDPDRDGMLKPVLGLTPAATVLNIGIHAWWQKWIHSYRAATILEKDGDYCKIELDLEIAPTSPLKWLPENRNETIIPDKIGGVGNTPSYIDEANIFNAQPLIFENVEIDYMDCNGLAFEVDDHVVVEFTTEQENGVIKQTPKVIGFVIEPRPCCTPAIVAKINNPSDIDNGKKFIYYRDKNNNWKTREILKAIDYGFVGWLGEKQTLTFKTPVNRQYHGGTGLSNQAFLCGKPLPDAPYNIIGGCVYLINGKRYPVVVGRVNAAVIAFFYLQDDDQWNEIRRFENLEGHEGRALQFNNVIYFSENGLKASTIATDIYRYPQPPFFQQGYYINCPVRIDFSFTALTSISYSLVQSSRTISIDEVNAYSTIINLQAEFAVGYDGNDLKTFSGDFSQRISVYSPPAGGYAYYPLPTNSGIWIQSIEDFWCENGYGRGYPILCETGAGYGKWSFYGNYGCATHEACYKKFETTKNREFGTAGITGTITTLLNLTYDEHELGKMAYFSNVQTYSQYQYTTYETAYNFWVDIWGSLDVIEYSGVSAAAVPDEVEGFVTRKFVQLRYTADFFGAFNIVIGYVENTVGTSTSRSSLVDKYPGGATAKTLNASYPAVYDPVNDTYQVDIKINGAYNLKSSLDASFTVEKKNPRYTVTMADPVTDFLILAGDNELLIYYQGRLKYQKAIEYELDIKKDFKVNNFDDNQMGIWNNLPIEFTANRNGDFLISDGETFGELRGYALNKWTEVGLV